MAYTCGRRSGQAAPAQCATVRTALQTPFDHRPSLRPLQERLYFMHKPPLNKATAQSIEQISPPIHANLKRHDNTHTQAVIQVQGGLRVVNVFTKAAAPRRTTCPRQVARKACMTAPNAKPHRPHLRQPSSTSLLFMVENQFKQPCSVHPKPLQERLNLWL